MLFEQHLVAHKRILIIGGGSGLGRSLAERIASLGDALVLPGRRVEVLEEAAQALRETGARVDTHAVDVRDATAVDAMLETVFAAPGGLDVPVNNAAANFIAGTETLLARAFDTVIGVPLHGPAYCTLLAGKRWIAQGKTGETMACVLNILAT